MRRFAEETTKKRSALNRRPDKLVLCSEGLKNVLHVAPNLELTGMCNNSAAVVSHLPLTFELSDL